MRLWNQLAEAKNNLQDAKNRHITGWAIFVGGFVGMFIVIGAMEDEYGNLDGGAFLMMFIMLGIALAGIAYAGDNGAAAQEEIDRLKRAVQNEKQRKRRQEKQRKNRETKKKQEQEKKKKELNLANELMEIGGIENLNKAIGIFEKYE